MDWEVIQGITYRGAMVTGFAAIILFLSGAAFAFFQQPRLAQMTAGVVGSLAGFCLTCALWWFLATMALVR